MKPPSTGIAVPVIHSDSCWPEQHHIGDILGLADTPNQLCLPQSLLAAVSIIELIAFAFHRHLRQCLNRHLGQRASDSKGTRLVKDLYQAFFLRSAQRLFIANDKRLRPSGVRPLPLLSPVITGGRGVAAFVFSAVRGNFVPSSSEMARLSRSLSCFKSATIFSMFKLRSFPLVLHRSAED